MKITLSLDSKLVERLDAEAKARGLSRSTLVTQLVADVLGVAQAPGTRPEVRAALARLDALFQEFEWGEPPESYFEDSTAAIRAERDSR